jgi:hypothetical protein
LICVESLGGIPALTRTGRNRAAINPIENFMAMEFTEKERFLHGQGERRRNGLYKDGLTCVNGDLLTWAK